MWGGYPQIYHSNFSIGLILFLNDFYIYHIDLAASNAIKLHNNSTILSA